MTKQEILEFAKSQLSEVRLYKTFCENMFSEQTANSRYSQEIDFYESVIKTTESELEALAKR